METEFKGRPGEMWLETCLPIVGVYIGSASSSSKRLYAFLHALALVVQAIVSDDQP